jgi:uncharacterized membrane protein (UPF0182 family)
MNVHEFNQGLILGLMAMVGVFVVLAIIGFILYAFELLLYKGKEKEITTGGSVLEIEEGIPKKVVAAIVSAIYLNLNPSQVVLQSKRIIRIKRKRNSIYRKLKEERWKK